MPDVPLDAYPYFRDRSGNGMGVVDIPAKVLPVSKGGTGLDHYEVGDLLTANTTTSLTRLDAEPVGKVLISKGEDVMPDWGGVPITGYSGTLPPINGGTGTAVTFSQGSIVFAGPGGAYAQDNLGLNYNDAYNTVGMGAAATPETRMRISANITGGTIAYGALVDGTVLSDVTATAAGFITGMKTQATPFALSLLAHFYATQPAFGAGSVVTSQVGFSAGASLGGGVNNFGFFGDVPVGANNYNFYANSNAKNLFKGPTSVGADPALPMEVATKQYVDMKTAGSIALMTKGSVPFGDASGSLIQDNANFFFDDARDALGVGSAPAGNARLTVSGNSAGSGGFSYGTLGQQIVQSDVSVEHASFISVAKTQAVAFTLPSHIGYKAQQGPIGAGSAITTQIGFKADATLIGGVTNIGFDSEIPAGANRWNFYAAGTADNYMASRLGIGTTAILNDLDVSKSVPAGTVGMRAHNSATGTALARMVIATGTANAYTISAVFHNNGSPYAQQAVGPDIQYVVYDSPMQIWRSAGGAAELMRLDSAGRLGLGAPPGGNVKLSIQGALSGDPAMYSVYVGPTYQSGVTTLAVSFSSSPLTVPGLGLANLQHFVANGAQLGSGSFVGTQWGFVVGGGFASGGNINYGFYSALGVAPNNWNIYFPGDAQNAIQGKVRIGSTVAPTVALDVTGPIQATSYVLGSRLIPSGIASAEWGLDFAGLGAAGGTYVTIANNTIYDLSPGSGLVAVYDDEGGAGAAIFFLAYGGVSIMIQNGAGYTTTVGSAGKVNLYYDGAGGKYRIQNLKGATLKCFISGIRMRASV